MKTAIFPGTFDPFTTGHFDVMQRALLLFDKLIIAIGDNRNKKTLFTPAERAAMITQAVQNYADKVQVATYDCLTVDFCRKHNATFIVRGIRTVSDFDFENIVAQANQQMAPDIESIFFPSRPEHSYICSSVVRDILLHGGDVTQLIPEGMNVIPR